MVRCRRAEPEAVCAGLSAAEAARSRFFDLPIPAVPASDLLNAMRAGWADGLDEPFFAWATVGLSAFVGEVTVAATFTDRAGVRLDGAAGLMLGRDLGEARFAVGRATCVVGLAAVTSSD